MNIRIALLLMIAIFLMNCQEGKVALDREVILDIEIKI